MQSLFVVNFEMFHGLMNNPVYKSSLRTSQETHYVSFYKAQPVNAV
jgi:hypothetical protein